MDAKQKLEQLEKEWEELQIYFITGVLDILQYESVKKQYEIERNELLKELEQ